MKTQEKLEEKGIRPSVTRIKIYEYLVNHRTHPTVDEIYEGVSESIPTLSRTTVYNTVKLLGEKGLVKIITIDGQQVRADADTSIHGHFMCEKCGVVFDFDVDEKIMAKVKAPEGFKTKEKEVYYMGICRKCLEENK